MKVTRTVEVDICDVCKIADALSGDKCHECGMAFCYKCSETARVTYRHSVYGMGSGDLHFCLNCEANLFSNPTPLYAVYLQIKQLALRIRDSNEAFDAARKRLEVLAARLYKEATA